MEPRRTRPTLRPASPATRCLNQEGIFVFPGSSHRRLSIADKQGGIPKRRKGDGIVLLTGDTYSTCRFHLPWDWRTSLVEVTSAAPLIRTASSSIQTSVDQKQMQDLPLNGRSPVFTHNANPGHRTHQYRTQSGQQDNVGLTVNGLRATQNNFQLDGAVYNDRFFNPFPSCPIRTRSRNSRYSPQTTAQSMPVSDSWQSLRSVPIIFMGSALRVPPCNTCVHARNDSQRQRLPSS